MRKILGFISKLKSTEETTSVRLEALMARGLSLQRDGQLGKAAEVYKSVLGLDPDYWDALNAMAEIAVQEGQLDDAIRLYDALIERDRSHPKGHYKRANVLNRLGRWDAALDGYNNAIGLDPEYATAYCNRGAVLEHLGRWDEALASYDQAIACDGSDSFAFYNRGSVLKELKRFDDALASYDRAIALNGDYIEAYVNRGHVLRSSGKIEAALASYDEAIKRKPIFAEAFQGRGLCLSQLQRFEEALISHEQAIQLKGDFVGAHISRGNILKGLHRLDPAIESYVRAIELEPFHAEAFEGYGFCLFSRGLIEGAIRSFNRALELEPDRRYLLGLRRHAQMHVADWQGWAADLERVTERLMLGAAVVQPFILSALIDSPLLQRVAAEIWVREECPPDNALGEISRRKRDTKIRVGYFSADFRAHPVALLTAELFETHDRSRFEIIAFASSPDSQDAIRERLQGAFDHFIDVYGQSANEVASLARQMGIDIAVDLGGFTVHNRTGIFALRAAPIQLSYIGFLGTMGAPYMDYLAADETIIPPENRRHYSEKILYLPSYQVNDSLRRAADRTFDRRELGLPEMGFVFCCFNATYKLTPATFDIWMRILLRVPASSLFLYVDNKVAQVNLSRQAKLHEVDPARIVFGERVPFDHYLSRFRAMDLFLDTSPYNAGATASDALWAGLPVLTCVGQSFASRYAASLLKAVELPELITTTTRDYEDLAVRLATTPNELASIRERLVKNRGVVPLFNTPLFTKNLEYAYTEIYERWQANLPPKDIYPAP